MPTQNVKMEKFFFKFYTYAMITYYYIHFKHAWGHTGHVVHE